MNSSVEFELKQGRVHSPKHPIYNSKIMKLGRKADVEDYLKTCTGFSNMSIYSEEFALFMDNKDPLKGFRSQFYIPRAPDSFEKHDTDHGHYACLQETSPEAVYFCGHSLGLCPRRVHRYLQEELDKWKLMGVEGHFLGRRPWASISQSVTPLMSRLVGADPDECCVMNTLSTNLHQLLVSFYQPHKPETYYNACVSHGNTDENKKEKRHKILIEKSAFCSDHHIVTSQMIIHGIDVKENLIYAEPREGEFTVSTKDLVKLIRENKDDLCLVLLGGVQFYTGQMFDMAALAKECHKHGIFYGVDLAHAVGNVQLSLHDWEVDFAAWCSYKYLNAGPGSIGGAFVHNRYDHMSFEQKPRLLGWWGQSLEQRFSMDTNHSTLRGAGSFALSNPAVLPTVCLRASLEVFHLAGFENVRLKSILLTGYLDVLMDEAFSEWLESKENDVEYRRITPGNIKERGAQLSYLFKNIPGGVKALQRALSHEGVIVDVRNPDVIRVAPVPLYNTFLDVYKFVKALKRSVKSIVTINKSGYLLDVRSEKLA